ncbi:hypothetical protein GR702_15750 [Novosphingobium sp. FGD1]|jgi:hypothetical protein|uniref:Uncharacterized protein n=1 Tax=Novosphingobium silvae TaxID=2692619 RepID=A0A7X4GIE8_9SPHN|nr:hypothetical protein [Novosphingobium silvae]MYL99221.1 hypothetical protein [Novosphingobium silvae]
MKTWAILLGGLLVWAVHFFGLYAIAEFAPSRMLTVILTVPCLAAEALLLIYALRLDRDEAFTRWRRSVAVGGTGLGLVAVLWQALPPWFSG